MSKRELQSTLTVREFAKKMDVESDEDSYFESDENSYYGMSDGEEESNKSRSTPLAARSGDLGEVAI